MNYTLISLILININYQLLKQEENLAGIFREQANSIPFSGLSIIMKAEDWFKSPTQAYNSTKDTKDIYAYLEQPSPELLTFFTSTSKSEFYNLQLLAQNTTQKQTKLYNVSDYLVSFVDCFEVKIEQSDSDPVKTKYNLQGTLSPDASFEHKISSRSKKYKIRTLSEKQQILAEVEQNGLGKTSKKYKVSVNNICRWRKRCDRKTGAGRKVSDPSMETQLISWIQSQQQKITRNMIKDQAKKISNNPEFKGSKGWFQRLLLRHPQLKKFICV